MTSQYHDIAYRRATPAQPSPSHRPHPAPGRWPYPSLSRADLAKLVGEMLG